jgi:hypothetical protein
VCAEEACSTVLSRFNDDPFCWQHRQPVRLYGGPSDLGATLGRPAPKGLPIGDGIDKQPSREPEGEQPSTSEAPMVVDQIPPGSGVEEPEAPEEHPPAEKRGRGKCSVCGDPTHNITTCPVWAEQRERLPEAAGLFHISKGKEGELVVRTVGDEEGCDIEGCTRRAPGHWHTGPNAREANARKREQDAEAVPDAGRRVALSEDGHAIRVELVSGGWVEMRFSGNVFALDQEDREFLFRVADTMRNYARSESAA